MAGPAFSVTAPEERSNGTTYFRPVGAGWRTNDGVGLRIVLETYPFPSPKTGRVTLIVKPAQPRSERVATAAPAPQSPRPAGSELDDDVPF